MEVKIMEKKVCERWIQAIHSIKIVGIQIMITIDYSLP
jgi:hypothetical protein